jgi:hypothetical protein
MHKIFNPNIIGNGILWILGAAMQIGGWVSQSIAITLLVIAFIWSIAYLTYWLKRRHNKKFIKNEDIKIPVLKIGAKVESINTAGYYDRVDGGYPEGDKLVIINIVLTPTKPMTLDLLSLDILGNRYEIKEPLVYNTMPDLPVKPLFPSTIQNTISKQVFANIPKQFSIDTKEAKIYALASDLDWYSEPFEIKFGETK